MSQPKKPKDYAPVTVPFAAIPTGETPGIAQWAHRAVWTDHMLATLESGVKGGRWHTLIDKVIDPLNLYAAARKVLGKAGAAGNYFRHCHWSIFREYDGFIRRRLRRLLVKRHRLNPRRQPRNHRWPNVFFARQGLYSLCEAHLGLVQSLAGNY